MLTIDVVGVTYLFGLWFMVDGVHRNKLSAVITLMLTLTLDYHNHAGDFCYYLWT